MNQPINTIHHGNNCTRHRRHQIASAIFFLTQYDVQQETSSKRQNRARSRQTAADILAKLLTVARKSRLQIDGVGVCIRESSVPKPTAYGPQHTGWDNYPLYEELRCVTPPEVDIYIDSDRTCYMYGEMWQGAAKTVTAVFIAVGTGIGIGADIIIDGHVLHGASDIIGATGWIASAAL